MSWITELLGPFVWDAWLPVTLAGALILAVIPAFMRRRDRIQSTTKRLPVNFLAVEKNWEEK